MTKTQLTSFFGRTVGLLLIAACFAASAFAAEPLKHVIWQLQDYNMDHIRQVLDEAKQSKVTRIQLSHNIIMNAEDVMDPKNPAKSRQLVADINQICRWAHERGIAVDVWVRELRGIPKDYWKGGKINLDDPQLWNFISEKYRKVFGLCPDIDGLVVSLHETEVLIFEDKKVTGDIKPDDRVAMLIDRISDVCKNFHKKLFVRDFTYEPPQLKAVLSGMNKSKGDFVVMSKCVPVDWQPFYPSNPGIGAVENHEQVVEFDLGHEFTGLSRMPYTMLGYIKRHLDWGIKCGIAGAVFRLERYGFHSKGTPNEANVVIGTQMLHNPDMDYQRAYTQWLHNRYGAAAARLLEPAFNDSFHVVNKSFYALGEWVGNHSHIPGENYANDCLEGYVPRARWQSEYAELNEKLRKPDMAMLHDIDADSSDGVQKAQTALELLSQAKAHLTDEAWQELTDQFERQLAMVETMRSWKAVYFGRRAYQNNPTPEHAAYLKKATDDLEAAAEKHRIRLIELASNDTTKNNQENYRQAKAMVERGRKTLVK